jgi:hypothetical protein
VVKEEMEEMEEDGVWDLRVGGGVVNVSILRSGSKGELDGEGEGVWTFIGKVKARGVGEITLSIGVVVTGSATATSRAWTKVSEGMEGWTSEYSHCAGVSRVRMAGMIVSLFVARA